MSGDSTEQRNLSDKQKRFVDLYCGADGGSALLNKSEAARLAGYSEKSARRIGHELYKTPHIRARIDEYFAESGISRDSAIALMVAEAVRSDDEILTMAGRAAGQAAEASIASSLIHARTTQRTNLAKMLGLFTENINLSGGIDVQIVGVDLEQL